MSNLKIGECIYKCTKCGKRVNVDMTCYPYWKSVSIHSDYPLCYGLHKCHDSDDECGFLMADSFIVNDNDFEFMAKDIKGEIVVDYIKLHKDDEEENNNNDNQ